MSYESYSLPTAAVDAPLGAILGLAFSFVLFVGMAMAQIMGDVKPPKNEFDEIAIALQAPEMEEFEDEEIVEEEEVEEEPELEEEQIEFSLDALDLALNPGSGGELVGDFALPSMDNSQEAIGTFDVFDLDDLDEKPRRMSGNLPKYPKALERKKISGRVVIGFVVNANGTVQDIEIKTSTRPEFAEASRKAVAKWKFEPGIKDGRKVNARVRLTFPFGKQ